MQYFMQHIVGISARNLFKMLTDFRLVFLDKNYFTFLEASFQVLVVSFYCLLAFLPGQFLVGVLRNYAQRQVSFHLFW